MKKNFKILLVLLVIIVGINNCTTAENTVVKTNEIAEKKETDSLMIYYDTAVGKDELLKEIEKYGATFMSESSVSDMIAIKLPKNVKLEDAISYFKNVKGVIEIEKNEILTIK